MKTFTIDADNNITAFHSTAAARKSGEAPVFNDAKSLGELAAGWPAARLIEIWNSLTGVTPVKKFKDRATAVTRIMKALESLEPALEAKPATCEEAAADMSGKAREGSKRARILELMRQAEGVTLGAIMAETGWQKHTVRGFVSGSLVRKGVAVESFKREDGQRAYRVQA